MFCTPRRDGSEGPLCHSTPKTREPQESGSPDVHANHLPVSVFGWYRVLVFNNDRWEINRALRLIRRMISPLELQPRYLHSGGEFDAAEDAGALFTFYVNAYNVASALSRLGRVDNRLWLRVNHRMPVVRYDAAHRMALMGALRARYDPWQQSLDLSQFHHDRFLEGMFFALASPHCMSTVLGIVAQEVPNLQSLRLDGNHLSHLQPFWQVERRLPRLQSISLENNALSNLALLQVLQFLPLVELNLKRNPLPLGYELGVLHLWPSLQKLNGASVPPGMDMRHPCDPLLILKVSEDTGMNWMWCRKLLVMNNCDYGQTLWSFQVLLHLGYFSNQVFFQS